MSKILEFQIEHKLIANNVIDFETISTFANVHNISILQACIFLGQTFYETKGFTAPKESLNYSVQGLTRTFSYYRKRPLEAARDGRSYLKKASQEVIANKVYADKNRGERYKLGNIHIGDGWLFIGRGSGHTTGRKNYQLFADSVKDQKVMTTPELLENKYFWQSGIHFFDKNKIWDLCTGVTDFEIDRVTAKINEATNSYEDRAKVIKKLYAICTKRY